MKYIYRFMSLLLKVLTVNYYLFLVLFWVVFMPVVFFYGAITAVLECIKDNKLDRESYLKYRKEFWGEKRN